MSFVKTNMLAVLFLWGEIIFSSVCMSTFVRTPLGLVFVEDLCLNNELVGYSVDGQKFLNGVVTYINKVAIDSCIEITTENGCICVPQDQLFFDPVINKWVAANQITTSNYFLNAQLCYVKCIHVKNVLRPTIAYYISTTVPHTFFATEQELLTHNFFPVVIGVSWLFGLGSIEFGGLSIAAILAGTSIGIKLFKSKKYRNKESKIVVKPYIQSAGGSCPDPDDDHENKKKRKFNAVSKSEFFKKVKDQYEYWKDGIYKRRPGAKGIENAEFLKWDHLHGEVEAYSKSQTPLGAIDPKTLKIYKVVSKFRRML